MNELINIKNQQLASEFFNQSLNKNRLVRSYLLTGRALKDKLEIIKQLNLVLNCKVNGQRSTANDMGIPFTVDHSPLTAACMQCQNCRWIENDTHPRTPLILKPKPKLEAKTNTEAEDEKEDKEIATEEEASTPQLPKRKKDEIDIAQARALMVELSQSSEYFRIVVIMDASLKVFGDKPANALLQIIEEAKSNTVFMLLCESEDNVLSTVVSRSQVIHFNSSDVTEYQEPSHELYDDLKQWLESEAAGSRLEQILKAEKLAEMEDIHLVGMLGLLQDQYSTNAKDLQASNRVLDIESAITDIRAFVRKKAVLGQLLKELQVNKVKR